MTGRYISPTLACTASMPVKCMAPMPSTIGTAAIGRRHGDSDGRLKTRIATPLPRTAGTSEIAVSSGSYDTATGRRNASIAVKCIAQMPSPMTPAPSASHVFAARRLGLATMRSTTARAANAATIAMPADTATRPGSWCE